MQHFDIWGILTLLYLLLTFDFYKDTWFMFLKGFPKKQKKGGAKFRAFVGYYWVLFKSRSYDLYWGQTCSGLQMWLASIGVTWPWVDQNSIVTHKSPLHAKLQVIWSIELFSVQRSKSIQKPKSGRNLDSNNNIPHPVILFHHVKCTA